FFSSRRRHTSSKRDWSSDVCSSDLFLTMADSLRTIACRVYAGPVRALAVTTDGLLRLAVKLPEYEPYLPFFRPLFAFVTETNDRSEERRVGKEWRCRCAWSSCRCTF